MKDMTGLFRCKEEAQNVVRVLADAGFSQAVAASEPIQIRRPLNWRRTAPTDLGTVDEEPESLLFSVNLKAVFPYTATVSRILTEAGAVSVVSRPAGPTA